MPTITNAAAEAISIKDEVSLLRSSIIGLLGKDEEGDYKPEMV